MDSCPFKASPTFKLNHIVQRLEEGKIKVQAFVFLLSVRKKILVTTIIKIISRIIHTLHDAILYKI